MNYELNLANAFFLSIKLLFSPAAVNVFDFQRLIIFSHNHHSSLATETGIKFCTIVKVFDLLITLIIWA